MTPATAAAMPVAAQPTPLPPPATIEDTGLHPDTLAQLLLKTLVAGESSGTNLSEKIRLPYSVLDALIQHARVEKLLEVRGASGAGAAGYRFALTDLGRDRAGQFLELSRYVGPAPVPLGAVQRLRPRLHGRPALCRQGQAVDRVRAADRQQADARSARASGQFRKVAVPLRGARQR